MMRHKVPRVLASILMISLSTGIVIGAAALATPAMTQWIEQAPLSISRLLNNDGELKDTLDTIQQTSKQMSEVVSTVISMSDAHQRVLLQQQDWTNLLMGELKTALTLLLLILTLTLFLLVSGGGLIINLIRLSQHRRTRQKLVRLYRKLPQEVGRYIGAAFLINLATGLLTSAMMAYLQVPMPWIWIVLVTLLRFIPYLGVGVLSLLMLIVSASHFHHLLWIAIPTLSFVILTTIVGMFIDPYVHGFRLKVNPVVVFVSVIFWGWLWGVAGAIIAVPMLTVALVTSEIMQWNTFTRIVTTRSS